MTIEQNPAKINQPLKIEVDLNVLNHLGIGLYSNTPAVITEIVANAWDADATEVAIDLEGAEIRISDDGHGMDYEALQNKFLTVGYARRKAGEEKTPKGRQCMGRKGIGKLAMFSLATEIHLISATENGDVNGFVVQVDALKDSIEKKEPYFPVPIRDFSSYPLREHGTLIVLRKLEKEINKTETYIRRRVARRFSIIGGPENFNIAINGKNVSIADRGFYGDIQFLWTFGNQDNVSSMCPNVKRTQHFDGVMPDGSIVNGFIASVLKPEQLKQNDDNNNAITLLANGRIFEEDIQKRIDDSRVFNSYLVGELQYDKLDSNELADIAVSSRQGVQENDPRFQAFLGYIRTRLNQIALKWDEWRRELGAERVVAEFPRLEDWLNTLSSTMRTKAKQLITKVNTMRFTGTEDEQKAQRKEVVKAQVLAFEKLRLQENIDDIQSIDVEQNLAGFREVMITVEDIEATLHREIIEQRLAVIRKLEQQSGDKVRERVVQEHIYSHLWLVDSSWGYTDEPTDYELRLTEHLRKACPDSTEGARLDIGYRNAAGRYVVIELKKPGLPVDIDRLIEQGTKYSRAMKQYFHDNPGSAPGGTSEPAIDIVFLVDKQPSIPSFSRGEIDSKLSSINARITTYNDLVNQAMKIYDDYLQASRKADRIREIVDSI